MSKVVAGTASLARALFAAAFTGQAAPSLALSTFTNNDWDVTADGSTEATLTLTLRDTDGDPMVGKSVAFTVERTFVDAGDSTFTGDQAEIATTTGLLNLVLTVVNADGDPLPGIPTASIVPASTGSNNTFTPVDSVTNHNGQYGLTFSSTTAEAKTISVTVAGLAITQTVAVTVTGSPSLPVMVFFSDWSTATGTSDNAKGDGGKWETILDTGDGLDVIVSTGLDLPTTNALQVTAIQADSGTQRLAHAGLGTLTDGNSRWFRAYYRNMQLLLDDESQHPIESGQTGGFTWVMQTFVNAADNQWNFRLLNPSPAFFWQQYWTCPKLDTDVTYRLEWQVKRLSSTTFEYHARVYDAAGVLLYDDDDFVNQFSSNGVGAGTVSFSDLTAMTTANFANVDTIRAGLNGLGGTDWYPSYLYGYQAGLAVSDDTWCGAYDAGNG